MSSSRWVRRSRILAYLPSGLTRPSSFVKEIARHGLKCRRLRLRGIWSAEPSIYTAFRAGGGEVRVRTLVELSVWVRPPAVTSGRLLMRRPNWSGFTAMKRTIFSVQTRCDLLNHSSSSLGEVPQHDLGLIFIHPARTTLWTCPFEHELLLSIDEDAGGQRSYR